MKTTLNKIHSCKPCKSRYKELLRNLKKTKSDDCEIEVLTILNLNGFDDALWSLRAVEGYERELRLFAVWCGKRVEENIKDERSIEALKVAEKFANGRASKIDLMKAWSNAEQSFDGAWPADENAAKAALTSAKWFSALAKSNEVERQIQEQKFRQLLSECRN